MAFRFKREGAHVKNRMHMDTCGMTPWLEDWKLRTKQNKYLRFWLSFRKFFMCFSKWFQFKIHIETKACNFSF